MNISYEQIKAFVAVADTGSFSAAARRLNKHRTTLGQVISNLEIEVNMTLFDRSGKFPKLTEQGEVLLRHAKSLHHSSTAFESLCLTVESGVESNITIYHSDLLPIEIICSVMKDIRERYPNVNVHWLNRHINEVRKGIVSGDADLGIVLLDSDAQGSSASEYVYLMSVPFVVVASCDFLHQTDNTISVRDLKNHRQLLLEEYLHSGIHNALASSLMIQRVENINVLKSLLSINEGWTIVPQYLVEKELRSGSLIELNISELNTNVRFPVAVWYMNEQKSGPIRRLLIEKVCQYAKQYEDLVLHK